MEPRPDHGETSYRGSGRLAGRKALITGGDSGMGRAAAIAFAREGADVAINYLPDEEPDAQEVIELIKDEGRKGVAIPATCATKRSARSWWTDAVQGLGGLDILVCNAGAPADARASILDVSTEDFDATMKTNIYAPFWIIKAALPHLKPGSAIIGTTSEQAYDPSPDLYDYAQTKAATMNYVKSLAKQLGAQGHPGQRRGAGADLDAAAGLAAAHDGEAARSSAARHRSGDPASRPSSPRSMSSSRRAMRAMRPARSTVRPAEPGSRRPPQISMSRGSQATKLDCADPERDFDSPAQGGSCKFVELRAGRRLLSGTIERH